MEEVFSEVPDLGMATNGAPIRDTQFYYTYTYLTDLVNTESAVEGQKSNFAVRNGDEDKDAAREAAIAASRLKLAKLEEDRPLWEEQARRRAEREKAEEAVRLAKAARRQRAERKRAEMEHRARKEADQKARAEMEKEQKEKRRPEQEATVCCEWERLQRQALQPWTVQRALERYKALSESFDGTTFSENQQLTFDAIPWPVLSMPTTFTVEDIDWGGVELFFSTVQLYMCAHDYQGFVEKSHRRFHPD